MATQDLVQKAKDHLAAFAAKDWNRYATQFTDDVIYEEEATGQRAEGKPAVTDLVKRWAIAFPDLKAKVKESFSAGDRVVLEIEWDGTHKGVFTGPMGNIPPTGKHGKVSAVQVVTFEGGLISEVRHYFDLMTVLRQIGVTPGIGAARPSP